MIAGLSRPSPCAVVGADPLLVQAGELGRALGLDMASARIEVECLLRHVLKVDRARLIAHPELIADALASSGYRDLLERRLAGEPIAYLLGEREFFGRPFDVTPAVLIPRPETELLVELALSRMPREGSFEVLDVGTGSGCVAVTLAAERTAARVTAVDISAAALEIARANARALTADNVELMQGDCYAALDGRRFGLVVSNPPYVAAGDPHLREGDLRHEPEIALVAGADGLALLRRLVAGAPRHLLEGGWLLLEHGFDQAQRVRDLLRDQGFEDLFSARDLAGIERVSGGRWRG